MLVTAEPVQAQQKDWSITANLNSGDGYLDYTINDSTGDWQSRLEFPLDYLTMKINFKNEFDNYYLKESNLSISKNINNPNEPFIDSDWLYINFEDEPNIYAETNAEIDFIKYNANVIFDKNIISDNLNWGLGFSYSKRNYTMSGGYQNDYINMIRTEFVDNLEVLKYEVKIKEPYLSLNYQNNKKPIYISYDIEYSPYVIVTDYDNHILRNKTAVSDTKGVSLNINFSSNIIISENLKFVAGYGYHYIKSEGTQTQTFSDGSKEEVDQEINLKNKLINVSFEYKF